MLVHGHVMTIKMSLEMEGLKGFPFANNLTDSMTCPLWFYFLEGCMLKIYFQPYNIHVSVYCLH